MAGGPDRRTFVLALLGAGLAASLLRFPLAAATHGLWFLVVAALALVVLGLPLLLGEAALGQYRRRNAVDAYGPGAWRSAGFLLALGALLGAALLAVLAGWSARYVVDSFQGDWFDDPARHFRLIASGPDALLAQLAVLAAVVLLGLRGIGRGRRGAIGAFAVLALLLLSGLAVWANLQAGSGAGRSGLFTSDTAGLDASFVVAALLAGLLPALLATGVTTTLAATVHDRRLPSEATAVVLGILVGLLAALLFLGPLASSRGSSLSGDGLLTTYTAVPALMADVGGALGGGLVGCFFAALLLASLAGLLALLDVPATWLAEAFPSWTRRRAVFAAGLSAYLVALPFAFSPNAVAHLHQGLAWVGAPLAGILVSVHVGWARPEVLDGFRVGDARHKLDAGLRPALRYVVPPVLAILLLAGLLGFLRAMGWAHGSGGLWALAP